MQIISRGEAIKLGLTRFFTGSPCIRGHVAARKTHSYACVECARIHVNLSRHPELGGNGKILRSGRTAPGTSGTFINGELFDIVRTDLLKKDKLKATAKNAKRRTFKNGAEGYYSASDISELLLMQYYRCGNWRCQIDVSSGNYHVDHIVPMSKGGSNWPDNLQILCVGCNTSKGAKLPEDWV